MVFIPKPCKLNTSAMQICGLILTGQETIFALNLLSQQKLLHGCLLIKHKRQKSENDNVRT
uniref:Uncharacterized protein n=1 Tax=Rhizophora mucronata TaxID=61149 RepID=A0A2P2PYS7_RHIMU